MFQKQELSMFYAASR